MITYHDETGRFVIGQAATTDAEREAMATLHGLSDEDAPFIEAVFTDEATARDVVWRYGIGDPEGDHEKADYIAQYWDEGEEVDDDEAAQAYWDGATDRNGAAWVVKLADGRVALCSELPFWWREETDEESGPDNPVGR